MPEARFLDKESISIETKIRCCNQNVKSFFTSDEAKGLVTKKEWTIFRIEVMRNEEVNGVEVRFDPDKWQEHCCIYLGKKSGSRCGFIVARHFSGGLGCFRHALPASGVAYCFGNSQALT